jgi:MoxR-like ATPase
MLENIRAIVREEIANAGKPEAAAVIAPKHEFIHQTRDEVLELVQLGLNVYMKGAAGSGKTHVAQQIADIMGLALTPMQFDGFTSPILIKGYMDAQGKFSDTPVYQWLKSKDGGVLFVDEFDRGREDTLVCFNSLLANKYQMFANGEVLTMTDKHVIIAAGNTAMKGSDGVYTSARKQDASVLDRFVVVEWDYDTKLERTLAVSINPEFGAAWAKWVQNVRSYVSRPDSGIKAQVVCGMRAIMFGATMLKLPRYQNDRKLLVERCFAKGGLDAATVSRIIANVPLG